MKGLTIIELLIVLAIIAIIAAIVIPNLISSINRVDNKEIWMEECVKDKRRLERISQQRAEELCQMIWDTKVYPRMRGK